MRRDDALLLDMLIAARKIQQFTNGVDWASFETNTMVQSAVIREIQVVGEAARQVSDITRTAQPLIPWVEIVGMRHRIIHEYFDIDLSILWDTIQNDIPPLIEQLMAIVPPEEDSEDSDFP